MKKMLFSDLSLINKICAKEEKKNYRNRLKKIKSSLSLNPPKYPALTKDINNSIKTSHAKRNIHLNKLNNLNTINSFKKSLSSNNFDNFENMNQIKTTRNKFNSIDLKIKIFNIAQENLNMYKRLFECINKSKYDKNSLIKEYKNSQKYKKNKCIYPTIDFFKNKRISNYYCILNNKNGKLNSVFDNLNKYIKPKQKQEDININTYDNLFFSNDIKNEYKRNKLYLNNINTGYTHKKIKQYYKTFNSLIGKNDVKEFEINKEQEIKNEDIMHL